MKKMSENSKLEWRMYGLVPYNISPIQQGIQYGHAVQEYNNMMIDEKAKHQYDVNLVKAFNKWRLEDKTFIIYNGGTTNLGYQHSGKGMLNEYLDELKLKGIVTSEFYEPDLGGQLTAVVFLVDERVWDKKKYPDFDDSIFKVTGEYDAWLDIMGGKDNVWLREFLSNFRFA